MAMSSQEWWYQQRDFQEWWYQQHVYQAMFTNPEQSAYASQNGSGPSSQQLYQQRIPIEDGCIDPRLIELSSQQTGRGSGFSGFSDYAFDYRQGAGRLVSMQNHVSSKPPRFLGTIMEIDEDSLETEQVPVIEDTNEQFFNRPEIRELVSIPDTPGIPEGAPTPAQTEVEEPRGVVSARLSSPPHSSVLPSSAPLYTETSGVGVYRVERLIQAWGPHDSRQYLIRWEGWGEEFDSWEPAANVSDDVIADFERSRLRRRLSFKRQRRKARKWG